MKVFGWWVLFYIGVFSVTYSQSIVHYRISTILPSEYIMHSLN